MTVASQRVRALKIAHCTLDSNWHVSNAGPGSSQVQEQINQGTQVDVETSKRALALANEIYQTSSDSLVEIAQQGGTSSDVPLLLIAHWTDRRVVVQKHWTASKATWTTFTTTSTRATDCCAALSRCPPTSATRWRRKNDRHPLPPWRTITRYAMDINASSYHPLMSWQINIKKAPTPPMDIEILCKNKDDSCILFDPLDFTYISA